MTDDRRQALGLEGVDFGLGLRPKNIGARVKRVEDRRLLTGQGAFTGDRIVPAHCTSHSGAAIIRTL
jgi:hypothetical protein